jgi:hypothetical protein
MKKIFYITVCFAALAGTGSCGKFLDTQPKSTLTPENSFKTAADWQQTITAAYAMLQEVFVEKLPIVLGEFGTDEVLPFDTSWGEYTELHYYTLTSFHGFLNEHYTFCWEGIKRCNIVIDIPEYAPVDAAARASMIAQAKFLRAIYYFELVKMYGDVPILTSAIVNRNELHKPRESVEDVYALIVADMKAAQSLPATWENAADKGRATSLAASALLGRVYLQWGKPDLAIKEFEKVIGKFSLYDDYADIFDPANKNQEKENIFEIQFRHSGDWGLEGSLQHSYWGPRGVGGPTEFGGWGGFGPSQYLYDQYEAGDKRREAFFFTEFNGVIQSPPTTRKFFDPEFGNVIEDDGLNYTLIRYADVLLMMSEALNATDDTSGKKYDYLNDIRGRAGLTDITAADNLSKAQFADVLLKERLLELNCEHVRRWDLLRFGKLAEQVKAAYNIDIQPHHVLYPIPQAAMDANDAMNENNPGY